MNGTSVSQPGDARVRVLERRAFASGMMILGAVAAACLVCVSVLSRTPRPASNAMRIPFSSLQKKKALQHLGAMQWAFEPNVGQSDRRVKFLSRARDASVFLTKDSLYVEWSAGHLRAGAKQTSKDDLRIQFVGSNNGAPAVGENELPGKTNYLIGRNPAQWHTDVPNYSAVRYENLYPRVDARIYGGASGLEYDLRAQRASDLDRVALRIPSAKTRIDADGDLVMCTASHVLTMRRPYIYQMADGARRSVSGGYRILENGDVGFAIGTHRPDLPITVDPVVSIAYTTFLGGKGAEKGNSVQVDSAGDIYAGGTTTDITSFPETTTCNDVTSVACTGANASAASNLFVAKIDPNQSGASQLVYLTFIGGSGNDQGGIVALDNSAPPNLAILGWTTSPDFPTTIGSLPTGPINLTVSKLNGSGNGFIYSEYYGGNGSEATQATGAIVTNSTGGGIATDAAGDVFVTSDTTSTDLPQPAVPNGFQTLFEGTGTAPSGANDDGFLAEFDSAGTLTYATYFGIAAQVGSTSVAVDASGNAYVAGFTSQPPTTPPGNFPPVGANTFQPTYGGGADDGFVMEINPAGGAAGLVYASFLGGGGTDQAFGIGLDSQSPPNAYVTGLTNSTDFIPANLQANAFQDCLGSPTINPCPNPNASTTNAFIAVIAQTNSSSVPPFAPSLSYASYLGGSGTDSGSGITIIPGTSPAQVLLVGTTTSRDFPVICPGQSFTGAQDAFVSEFNPSVGGSASLLASIFLGGSASTKANAIATDASGDAIIFGDTLSRDYLAGSPQTGLQPVCASCQSSPPSSDAFLTKIAISTVPSACVAFVVPGTNFGQFPVGDPVCSGSITTNCVPTLNGTVTNVGNATLNFSGYSTIGPNAADFSPQGSGGILCTSATVLAPGAVCDLSIGFAPTIAGPETATLQVMGTDSSSNNLQQGIAFSGAGIASEVTLTTNPPPPSTSQTCSTPPACSVPVTFGSITVNTTSVQSVTVTNSGNAPLNITSITIPTSPTDFSLSSTNISTPCGAGVIVQPTKSCTIGIDFTPTSANSAIASVDIVDDANNVSSATQTIALSGTGILQTFIVSFNPNPPVLAFSQTVGTVSMPQSITLTNNGTGTLNITSITFAGMDPNQFLFDSTTTCPVNGGTVGPNGGSCNIAVDFAPTAVAPVSATVNVVDNATNNPPVPSLSGNGVGPVASLSSGTLTFGSVAVGNTSSTQTVKVTNTGNAPLVFNSVGLTGGNPGDFNITSQGCATGGSGLMQNSSCSVVVDFAPQASGGRFASLTFSDTAAGSPQSASLSGTGTQAGVSLSQGSLAFGNVNVNKTATLPSVVLTNTGNQTLTISSVAINPAVGMPADFAFSGANTCKTVGALQPNQTCTITVSFTPAAQGAVNGQVDIKDNAVPGTQSISLSGTGTAAGVTLTPASLTFSGQNVGPPPSPAQSITLKSAGTGPTIISQITITGANPSDFAQSNNCPVGSGVPLNAGSSCTINVTFTATATGSRSATLSVADDATPSPQTVALSGTGTAPAVHFSLFVVKFNDTVVGTPAGATAVQAVNSGNGPLVITNVGFVGANAGDFQASGPCVGANGAAVSVPAKSSCDIDINFVPTAVGARSATLSVTDNASGSPQQSVSISGTGTDFQLGPISGGSTSATVTAGETATFSLQITSNGFAGTATMSCVNPVPASGCATSPSPVVVSANQAAPFTVTVNTQARKGMAVPRNLDRWPTERPWQLFGAGVLLLMVLLMRSRLNAFRRIRLIPILIFLSGLLFVACGGNGGGPGVTGTPAGTYTITVSAASSGATRTVTLSLTVQ